MRVLLKISNTLSVLDLTYNTSCPSHIIKSIVDNQAFIFNLSNCIVSATPNMFDVNCMMEDTVMFAEHNKTKDNLNLQLLHAGDYRCVINHVVSQKWIIVNLKTSTTTNKNGKDNIKYIQCYCDSC